MSSAGQMNRTVGYRRAGGRIERSGGGFNWAAFGREVGAAAARFECDPIRGERMASRLIVRRASTGEVVDPDADLPIRRL